MFIFNTPPHICVDPLSDSKLEGAFPLDDQHLHRTCTKMEPNNKDIFLNLSTVYLSSIEDKSLEQIKALR